MTGYSNRSVDDVQSSSTSGRDICGLFIKNSLLKLSLLLLHLYSGLSYVYAVPGAILYSHIIFFASLPVIHFSKQNIHNVNFMYSIVYLPNEATSDLSLTIMG